MKRREFLKSSVALTSVAAMSSSLTAGAAEADNKTSREFYELRQYHLRQGPMLKRFDDFFREVGVPALNRAGVTPVGVFDLAVGPDAPTKYVLLPFKSLNAMAAAKPIVACRSAAHPLEHERNGLVIDDNDEDTFAAAAVRLMRDPALRAQLGTAARRDIEDHHTPTQFAEGLEQIFARVLASSTRVEQH